MRKAAIFSLISLLISIFLFAVLTCDFSPYEGQARIGIDLGSLGQSEDSMAGSRAVNLPQGLGYSDIASVTITISGPDINSTSTTYALPPRYLYIFVPAGKERTVGVQLNIDPSNASAVLAFGGENTVSLRPGQFQWVQIQMAPVKTKLVIPDYSNYRVVQINDISGNGWDSVGNFANSYSPYDVDFDRSGRIYIAKYGFSIADDIIRIDNINETNRLNIDPRNGAGGHYNTINSISIDTKNNILYFSNSGSSIDYFNLTEPQSTTPTATEISLAGTLSSIQAVAVDKSGEYIYLAARDSVNDWAIFRYEIQNGSIVSFKDTFLNTPRDILVKSSAVYVTNIYGTDNYKIIQLTKNLQFVAGFGIKAPANPNTNKGMFYGPYRFVAVLNDKITIVDDDQGDNADKLVSMDDINGSNWQTYGSTGSGIGLFNFFYFC